MSRPPARRCEDVVKGTGLPCPTNALRKPDPDGAWRCVQHTIEPTMREAVRLSRHKGAFKAQALILAGPAVVAGERYLTAEDCDRLVDEALGVLRLDLRVRKTSKPATAQAIATMIETKLKIRQLAWVADAQRRLNPVRERPA